MKSCWSIILIAAWLIAPAAAQTQPEQRSREGRGIQRHSREERPGAGRQAAIDRIREELELDQDQLVEFDRLAAEFQKQRGRGANMKSSRSLMQEMREARQAGNDERVAEIREELRNLRGGNAMQEFLNEIEGILRDDQREKLAQIRQRLAEQRGPRGRGPLAQLEHLRAELQLTEEQAEQYDEAYAELSVELRAGAAGGEQTEKLVQELIEAAEAGDEERIEQLKKQMPNPRQQHSAAVARFLEDIERFLEPDQVRTLDRFRQRMAAGQGEIDLRACFRFVSRLKLDEGQRARLREIQTQARESEREARRDPQARAQVTADVQKELREMLTDEQVAEFDRWLEQQQPERPGRGRHADRPGRGRHRERPPRPQDEDTP